MSENSFLKQSHLKIKTLGEKIGVSLPEESFCILPFTHLSTTTTGDVRLCCRSKSIGNIKKNSLKELWNSEKLHQVRDDLLAKKRIPECSNCWDAEDKGIVSLRQGQNLARALDLGYCVEDHLNNKIINLPTIELKLSNRCNLKCKMCSPAASTKWVNSWPQLKKFFDSDYADWVSRIVDKNNLDKKPNLDLFLSNNSFSEDFNDFASSLKLMDFAGGEPLIDPLHYQILRAVIERGKPEETILRYSTNLTVLSFEKFNVLELWNQFKEVHLTISVDGYSELNEYIRFGTKSHILEENIETIKKLDKVTSIKCSTTLNAYNALFVAETIDYVINTLKCGWHTSRVTSPSFLDARIWSQDQKKKAIEKVMAIDVADYNLNKKQRIQVERHIRDYVSWMESEDIKNSDALLKQFWDYTKESDQINKQSFPSIFRKL